MLCIGGTNYNIYWRYTTGWLPSKTKSVTLTRIFYFHIWKPYLGVRYSRNSAWFVARRANAKGEHLEDHDIDRRILALYLLTWRRWWAPNNASEGQVGLNSACKGFKYTPWLSLPHGQMGEADVEHSLLLTLALVKVKVKSELHLPGKDTQYPLNKRLAGPPNTHFNKRLGGPPPITHWTRDSPQYPL